MLSKWLVFSGKRIVLVELLNIVLDIFSILLPFTFLIFVVLFFVFLKNQTSKKPLKTLSALFLMIYIGLLKVFLDDMPSLFYFSPFVFKMKILIVLISILLMLLLRKKFPYSLFFIIIISFLGIYICMLKGLV